MSGPVYGRALPPGTDESTRAALNFSSAHNDRVRQDTPLDLLLDPQALIARARTALEAGDPLDAYLYTAGLGQLVDDALHPDPGQLHRAAGFIRDRRPHTARALTLTARALRPAVLAHRGPRLHAASRQLTAATTLLAGAVLGLHPLDPAAIAPVPADLPSLLGPEPVRIPACFRSFEQHPDDVAVLANRWADAAPTGRPALVVGIRTSGSHLAPFAAAVLTDRGIPTTLLSYRPGRPWTVAERRLAHGVTSRGGDVLLIDDPPVTGTALDRAATEIVATGIRPESIVMLLALDQDGVPPRLDRWRGIHLAWGDWSVHRRLRSPAVAAVLAELLGPDHRVTAVELPWPSPPEARARSRSRHAVRIHAADGSATDHEVAVEGAGLGYLGRHAVAIADALGPLVPHTYGHRDGLLYRAWLPDGEPTDSDGLVAAIAEYTATRASATQVEPRPLDVLRGRDPAWEVASRLLSSQFGRLAPVAQAAILGRAMRAMLATTASSVPDGRTAPRYWRPGPDGVLVKAEFHQGAFSNTELTCYDPVFDLAGAAVSGLSAGFAEALRVSYEARTSTRIAPERWLLYRLVQLARPTVVARDLLRPYRSDAVNDFLATVFPPATPDATCPGAADGTPDRICAVDLDGVLESTPLGFPCTTPAGALALRALGAHGLRPVFVTGRCLDDVRTRCRQFGVESAVAEYGAIVYDAATDTVTDLRTVAEREAVDAARAIALGLDGVDVDPRYRHVLRASYRGGAVPGTAVETILRRAWGTLRTVHGEGQTDFVPVSVDKGRAIDVLLRDRPARLELAVGDTSEDLPMLTRAVHARTPRNTSVTSPPKALRITAGAYQRGLAEACSDLLGHSPGGCPICQPPPRTDGTELMCAALRLREDGLRGLPRGLIDVLGTLRRAQRRQRRLR